MKDDIQQNVNTPESNEHPIAKRFWIVLFLIGGITLVFVIHGMMHNEATGSYGLQGYGTLTTVMLPFFIGIPATLLSFIPGPCLSIEPVLDFRDIVTGSYCVIRL